MTSTLAQIKARNKEQYGRFAGVTNMKNYVGGKLGVVILPLTYNHLRHGPNFKSIFLFIYLYIFSIA